MHLTRREKEHFYSLIRDLTETEEAREMKTFIQHGQISTFDHVLSVACVSYYLNLRFRLGADERSLVRGAFLHDFYLYDWHKNSYPMRFHGFRHPFLALENAQRLFTLNKKEKNIIASHMWPLTIWELPKCREAAIVCAADKFCSSYETILRTSSIKC